MDSQVFKLIVYAKPVAQERPRGHIIQPRSGKSPFINFYDPPKSKAWKKMINSRAQDAVFNGDFKMFPKAIALVGSFEFVIDRPQSVSVKKRPHHSINPDLDNFIKGVKDALNGVVYMDDGQIVRYVDPTIKRYADMDEQPCIKITIMPYEDWLDERSRISTGGATADASRQVSSMAGGTPGEALQNAGEVRQKCSGDQTASQES